MNLILQGLATFDLGQCNVNGIRVSELIPHVYHLEFDSSYDCAMHFLRFQEYYESPKFYRQTFTLVDYMEWYVKDFKLGQQSRAFTYPRDWTGFNVPSHCLLPFVEQPNMIPDPNKYDFYMTSLIRFVKEREGDHPFYFIGTETGETHTLNHEIAHALYTVNESYRECVDQLLQGLGEEVLNKAREFLKEEGYHESTVDDEIHAYSATGMCYPYLERLINEEMRRPFIELFQVCNC